MDQTLMYLLLGIMFVIIIALIIMIVANGRLSKKVNSISNGYQIIQKQLEDINNDDQAMVQTVQNSFNVFGEMISRNQKDSMEAQDRQIRASHDSMDKRLQEMNERLDELHKNLGEMQSLAGGVDDLKKVLSNVKTRGILGEVQLGAILEQIFSKEQYAENIATVPGSTERVEFAVKFPGDNDIPVWLPIDSKFPGERYAQLRDAYENGTKEDVEYAWKALESVLKQEAKDIRTKYIAPPYTTDFGVMFLPFEGLYAEVINHGMLEVLQREYKVNIAGPTTMAAFLNSLQMGFRTLAIQKHSGEVWEILGAVKTEFENYGKVLDQARNKIRLADDELEKLVGVRTRAIERKLRNVEKLPSNEASNILDIDVFPEIEDR